MTSVRTRRVLPEKARRARMEGPEARTGVSNVLYLLGIRAFFERARDGMETSL
jgi:hypothetical protein